MSAGMDAIRASFRIFQALSRPGARPEVVSPAAPTADVVAVRGEVTAPRAIEGAAAGGGAAERDRELWARDMSVRAQRAAEPPDGELDVLPSYEYSVGPDGRVYATGDPPHQAPPIRDGPSMPPRAQGPDPPPELPTGPPRDAVPEATTGPPVGTATPEEALTLRGAAIGRAYGVVEDSAGHVLDVVA